VIIFGLVHVLLVGPQPQKAATLNKRIARKSLRATHAMCRATSQGRPVMMIPLTVFDVSFCVEQTGNGDYYDLRGLENPVKKRCPSHLFLTIRMNRSLFAPVADRSL
jgi:hypothetical protein